jgi:hypothetical protein
VEAIVTVFCYNNIKVPIRFQATPFIDMIGRPYKPILRGLCYIHPTRDQGLSDGKYSKDLQSALNDTINISNDRVMLATLPVMKVKRYSMEENDQIYIEPEHNIPLDNIEDLQELKITDNIQGAMSQAQLFISGMQKVTSIYPTTMGETGPASTTATAVAGAESRTNLRANYKSLTFENTFLVDLYWMILQMTARFAEAETLLLLLSPTEAQYFDPGRDYCYIPVSSNIEVESGKISKMKVIDQVLGRVVNMQNPKTPMLVNKLIEKFLDLLGADYADIKSALLDEGPVGQAAATNQLPTPPSGGPGQQPAGLEPQPVSNQNQQPISSPEAMVRGGQ